MPVIERSRGEPQHLPTEELEQDDQLPAAFKQPEEGFYDLNISTQDR